MPHVTISFILLCFDLWGADINLKLSEQLRGEGREDLSDAGLLLKAEKTVII